MEWILSKKELPKLCEYLDLKNHRGIYLFSGDLASGKTTLIQAMVASLGSKAKVTSPIKSIIMIFTIRIWRNSLR